MLPNTKTPGSVRENIFLFHEAQVAAAFEGAIQT